MKAFLILNICLVYQVILNFYFNIGGFLLVLFFQDCQSMIDTICAYSRYVLLYEGILKIMDNSHYRLITFFISFLESFCAYIL